MTGPAFDVLVVGARVAGAGLALRLAAAGRSVLLVDRSRRGTDTVSTHQLQVPGAAVLARWGLLGTLVADPTCAAPRARFEIEGVVVDAPFPEQDGVRAVHSPRRTRLDAALLDAACAAGAEVRERFVVEDLVRDGDRVVGVRGRTPGGARFVEHARLVVGADGRRSTVAAHVDAPVVREAGHDTFASYGYWAATGLGRTARMYLRPGVAVAAFPTDAGLHVVVAFRPLAGLAEHRRDPAAGLLAAADAVGDLGERLRSGAPVEHVRTTTDLPHRLRRAAGPGWALVGDAGAVLHPVSAHGMTFALQDADRVARALTGVDPAEAGTVDATLRAVQRVRDAEVRDVFDGTARLARLAPLGAVRRAVLAATVHDRPIAAGFVAAFTGTRPWRSAMTPLGLARLAGHRGAA